MKPTSTRTGRSPRALLLATASLGVALVAAGCTSGGNPVPPAASGTPAQVTDSGTGSAVPSPTVSGELAYVPGPELEKMLGEWSQTQPGSKVTTDAALRSQIPEAEKWLSGIKVEPAECGLYGIGSFKDQLDASVMVAVTLPEKTGADIAVASYPDLNELVADVAAQQHLDKSCATYSIIAQQQKITATLSHFTAQTSAPYSAGTVMSTTNEGTESKQLSVRAIDGNVMVTATRKSGPDTAEAMKLATADVEAVLTVLRDREAQAGAGK